MKEITILGRSPVRIALSGTIDSSNAEDFFAEVIALYNGAPSDITFECEQLEFIDSTALGIFVKLLKHAKTDGYTVRLTGLSARLKKLFVICALDRIMEIA